MKMKMGDLLCTFSSSSLVGDLNALLTAVNHELPPFFPMELFWKPPTPMHLHSEIKMRSSQQTVKDLQ